jgi:hypothetical protein
MHQTSNRVRSAPARTVRAAERAKENGMRISEVKDRLMKVIKEIVGGSPNRISEGASLTSDLGLDSLELMNLFAHIDRKIGAVDLMPWMIGSATGGGDTVDSLCRYVATALEAAEWRRAEA